MVQSIKDLDDQTFQEKFQKVREERGEMYDADGGVTPAWEYPQGNRI